MVHRALPGIVCAVLILAASAAGAHDEPEPTPPYLGVCLADGFPTTYDAIIRESWMRHAGTAYAGRVCRFTAQIRKESSARADAVSHAGAEGLGQQIAEAADDCRRAGLRGSRREARFSAGCGALLMAKHMRSQREMRGPLCRQRNAELCYVSGCGHVWAGQRAARQRLGLLARCPDDGILAGMELILRPDAYREASRYPSAIDRLERRAVPR